MQRQLSHFYAQPLTAEQQARAAEVAARVAAKQAAEDRRARRLQRARTFLQAHFGVIERREPGRPSKAEDRCREQVEARARVRRRAPPPPRMRPQAPAAEETAASTGSL